LKATKANLETTGTGLVSERPKLAMANIFPDLVYLKEFALEHGFEGIDWSFDLNTMPEKPLEESMWARRMSDFNAFEVRYHCPFYRIDLGHHDPWEARAAKAIFKRIIRLVSKAGGKYLTIHIGLGHDSTEPLSWETTINNLADVVHYGAAQGVSVCLENLAWGWTSRPDLFEKLVRLSGTGVTFDIGHAYSCESVRSHQFTVEDFVTPHAGRVFNAHVYHKEVPNLGHLPPERPEDMESRLSLLQDCACSWWTLEVKEPQGLLQTKKIVEGYLERSHDGGELINQGRS
jgi:sugar phosphate isomerase/epimerase